MAPPFRKVSPDSLQALLTRYPFARSIVSVLVRAAGDEISLVGLWRQEVAQGLADVSWHLAVDADGSLALGRDWNLSSQGTDAFVIAVAGDVGAGARREAAVAAAAGVLDALRLPTGVLRVEGGTGSLDALLRQVQRRRAGTQEGAQGSVAPEGSFESTDAAAEDLLILGDDGEKGEEGEEEAGAEPGTILLGDDEPSPAAEPPVSQPVSMPASGGAGEVDDLVREMLRQGLAAGSATGAFPSTEGLLPQPITTDIKEALLPHAIDLTRGRLSEGGLFETGKEDVDAIFGEHLERAVSGRGPGNPLRIVIWAHGGLVNERSGLLNAYQQVLWWQRNGVYPLYFIWETGLLEALRRVITGRSGGEEGVFSGVIEMTDRRIEATARALGGPAVWSDMKQSARIAATAEDGGARYAAVKLAEFCRRHPGAVELHAVGHSAGAIFHASFLPVALEKGAPPFKGLYLLAPAIRLDHFHERLTPRIGAGKGIERCAIFTMNKLRELDDNCITIYRKSLLYLIHYALEDRRETPILGLEIVLRADARLQQMFGLGTPGPGAVGEVIWSKTPGTAGPRSRSRSTSHGGFDNDPATMDSVLRRVLGRDDIALSFEKAGSLTPDLAAESSAAPGPIPAIPAVPQAPPDIILGDDEGVDAGDGEEVPFTVLDAIERATEAAEGIGPQASEPEVESIFEAVTTIDISFGPNAKAADVTDFSRQVLTDILRAAGLSKVIVSSTSRLPADQARVMYANLESQGVDAQRKLYKEPGRKVIEVYRQGKLAGKDPATIKKLMTDEIVRLGPTTVSRHASDPKILNVFDVAPSSVAKRPEFEVAVRAEKRVAKFLLPPNDPGYHLEIPQPAQVG